MFTALVSPQYAERNGQATTVAGGFIAHGLVPPHRDQGEHSGWFYALLPGSPASTDPEHVQPFPATRLEAILEAERERYRQMARVDGDSVWADAASAISDMISCLHRARLHEASSSSTAING
ncbi:MAG: hypothetical protein ACLFSI_08075 [Halorhodospira sp.]